MRQSPVRAVGVNPIAFGFGFFECAGRNDAAAGAVRFQRAGHRLSCRHTYDGLQHLHDVVDRMILIVENDDMVEPFVPGRCIFFHVRFEGDGAFAVTGAEFRLTLDDVPVEMNRV